MTPPSPNTSPLTDDIELWVTTYWRSHCSKTGRTELQALNERLRAADIWAHEERILDAADDAFRAVLPPQRGSSRIVVAAMSVSPQGAFPIYEPPMARLAMSLRGIPSRQRARTELKRRLPSFLAQASRLRYDAAKDDQSLVDLNRRLNGWLA